MKKRKKGSKNIGEKVNKNKIKSAKLRSDCGYIPEVYAEDFVADFEKYRVFVLCITEIGVVIQIRSKAQLEYGINPRLNKSGMAVKINII